MKMATTKVRSGTTTASAPARRSYHHGDLRNALIGQALAQIASEGARALCLREVARRAGVSHTASYRHFPNKECLLAAIAEQGFAMLSDAMGAALRAHPDDPLAALQASGVAYVEFGVQYPDHLQIMFGGLIANHDDYPALKQCATRNALGNCARPTSASSRWPPGRRCMAWRS
jgi:AcrR family transcriptional regulator